MNNRLSSSYNLKQNLIIFEEIIGTLINTLQMSPLRRSGGGIVHPSRHIIRPPPLFEVWSTDEPNCSQCVIGDRNFSIAGAQIIFEMTLCGNMVRRDYISSLKLYFIVNVETRGALKTSTFAVRVTLAHGLPQPVVPTS